MPLNDVIQKIKPTYFIMDIEGGEYDVFSMIDFQTIKKIQFELHPEILGIEKVNQIFLVLAKHGFKEDKNIASVNNFYFSR